MNYTLIICMYKERIKFFALVSAKYSEVIKKINHFQ